MSLYLPLISYQVEMFDLRSDAAGTVQAGDVQRATQQAILLGGLDDSRLSLHEKAMPFCNIRN